jgi:AbiU2
METMSKPDYSLDYLKQQLEFISQAIQDGERAFSIYKAIGKNKESLDNSSYQSFFGASQKAFFVETIISLVSIYARPNKTYPTATLEEVIRWLKCNKKKNLQPVDNKALAKCNLGISAIQKFISETDIEKQACMLADYIKKLSPSREEDKDAWKKLKTIRDKKMAHNEIADPSIFCGIKGEYIDKKFQNAKKTVNIIGCAYFDGYHVPTGSCPSYEGLKKLMRDIDKRKR